MGLRTRGPAAQESTKKTKMEEKSFQEVEGSKKWLVTEEKPLQNQECVKYKKAKQEHNKKMNVTLTWFRVFKNKSTCAGQSDARL